MDGSSFFVCLIMSNSEISYVAPVKKKDHFQIRLYQHADSYETNFNNFIIKTEGLTSQINFIECLWFLQWLINIGFIGQFPSEDILLQSVKFEVFSVLFTEFLKNCVLLVWNKVSETVQTTNVTLWTTSLLPGATHLHYRDRTKMNLFCTWSRLLLLPHCNHMQKRLPEGVVTAEWKGLWLHNHNASICLCSEVIFHIQEKGPRLNESQVCRSVLIKQIH